MSAILPNPPAELIFTRDTHDPLGLTWTLRGDLGAVVFGPMGIDYHSPTPLYNDDEPTSDNCPAIGGNRCWADGSSLLGQQLRERWERADHDDAVIRTELESWYADFPARVAKVCGASATATQDGKRWSGTCHLAAGHHGNHKATMLPEDGAR